jgi:hypothetical protein
MLTYVGHLAAVARIDIDICLEVKLEPGVWIVREDDDREYTVTRLGGVIESDGSVSFSFPRGIARRPSGAWAAREQILHRALPRTGPAQAWAALPPEVRGVIDDTFLLARDGVPQTIGATP